MPGGCGFASTVVGGGAPAPVVVAVVSGGALWLAGGLWPVVASVGKEIETVGSRWSYSGMLACISSQFKSTVQPFGVDSVQVVDPVTFSFQVSVWGGFL